MIRTFECTHTRCRLTRFVLGAVLAVASVSGCNAGPVSDGEEADAGDAVTGTKDQPAGDTPTSAGAAAPSDDGSGGQATTAPPPPKTTDLFHKELGTPGGQPVVFVHGGPGGNATAFEDTTAITLSQRGFFVVTYDQRGAGRSPKGTLTDFTFAKAVEDLDDVIFTLGLKSPILIGHSWGGTIAVQYMNARRGVAKGAILVSNPVDYPDSLFNILNQCEVHDEEVPSFLGGGDVQQIQQLRARMFPQGLTPPYHFAGDDIATTIQQAEPCGLYFPSLMNALGSLGTWSQLLSGPDANLVTATEASVAEGFETNEHFVESDFSTLVTKLQPNLYGIYGDADGLSSDQQKQHIAELLTPGHFTLVHGASHFVFIDDEPAFLDAFTKYAAAMNAAGGS